MSATVIMVASGKGGTGKSTVSVLLGSELAARKKKTLLIELDSGLRSVDIISGVYGKTVYDIEDILEGRCEADKAIAESTVYPGLSVISAPYSGGHIQAETLQVITGKLAPFFDYIILDTAAGMGMPFLAARAVSHMALLVITPDPVTMRDGRIVSDDLWEAGVKNMRLIINRVEVGRLAKIAVKDLDTCIDTVCVQL
ncbi:MAG: AAA family ATPase, partial [Oscillospiraceae bacterium]|nr:AAA family ATPase [Oscillospiraceae bacterium]